MFQLLYTLILTSAFLGLGLVSCSPDNRRTLDSYKVSPPKIIRAGESEAKADLKQFDSDKNREFDLRDLIDASSGNPTMVKTRSRCRTGQREWEVSRVSRSSKFRILQIIPTELLLQELETVPFVCHFEIAVFNDIGSTHIFQLADVRLHDRHGNEIQITTYADEPAPEPLFLNSSNAQGFKVTFPYGEPVTGQVMCEDLYYAPVRFQNNWELKDFNERRHLFRATSDAISIASKSPQRCRILVSANEMPIATTPFFKVIIPKPPFAVQFREVAPSAVNEHGFQQTEKLTLDFAFKNRPLILTEYRIQNSTAARRWIRLPLRPMPVKIRSLFAGKPRNTWVSTVHSPSWLYLTAPGVPPVETDGNFAVFPIEGKAELVLQLAVMPPGPMNCIGNKVGPLFGLYIEPPTSQIEIREVGTGSVSVDSFFLPPPTPIYALSLNRALYLNSNPYQETQEYTCNWP
jgi:hypothetical protein